MTKKQTSQCKSESCGATNPTILDYELGWLSEDAQKRVRELGLEDRTLKHCAYCGRTWIDDSRTENGRFWENIIWV